MLRDGSVGVDSNDVGYGSGGDCAGEPEWKLVHRRLRSGARTRRAIDAEEARDLVRAEELEIWLELEYATVLEYMERELDYAPRTALDRLRVAKALAELPKTSRELAAGDLSYSVVRAVTRVATPRTEAASTPYWRSSAT